MCSAYDNSYLRQATFPNSGSLLKASEVSLASYTLSPESAFIDGVFCCCFLPFMDRKKYGTFTWGGDVSFSNPLNDVIKV